MWTSHPSSQVHNVLKRLRSHNLQISLIDQHGGGGSMHIFYFQMTLSPRVFFLHSIGDLLSRVDNNTIWVYIRQLSVPFLLCTSGPKVKLARIVYMPQCQCVQILFNFPFNLIFNKPKLSHWNIFPAFCQKYLLALLLASAPNLKARGLQNSSQRK